MWWYSVVVSINGCDPFDPGSNPGTAMFSPFQPLGRLSGSRSLSFCLWGPGGGRHSMQKKRSRGDSHSQPTGLTAGRAADCATQDVPSVGCNTAQIARKTSECLQVVKRTRCRIYQ